MRYQGFFLTDDAVDDLAELEAYVLTYQNDGRQVVIYRIRHLLSDFSRVGW